MWAKEPSKVIERKILPALLDFSFRLIGLVVYVLANIIEYLSKDIYHF